MDPGSEGGGTTFDEQLYKICKYTVFIREKITSTPLEFIGS